MHALEVVNDKEAHNKGIFRIIPNIYEIFQSQTTRLQYFLVIISENCFQILAANLLNLKNNRNCNITSMFSPKILFSQGHNYWDNGIITLESICPPKTTWT